MIKEIYRTGIAYRIAKDSVFNEMTKAYDNYVKLCILDEPREEQSKLIDMWEWEKE